MSKSSWKFHSPKKAILPHWNGREKQSGAHLSLQFLQANLQRKTGSKYYSVNKSIFLINGFSTRQKGHNSIVYHCRRHIGDYPYKCQDCGFYEVSFLTEIEILFLVDLEKLETIKIFRFANRDWVLICAGLDTLIVSKLMDPTAWWKRQRQRKKLQLNLRRQNLHLKE